MTDMKIHIGGKEADASASELAEFFADNLDTQVSPAADETLSDTDKKAIDPIAVAQLILAIPPAIDATPPGTVTRFQRNAARMAGVSPAPTTVYAVRAMDKTFW